MDLKYKGLQLKITAKFVVAVITGFVILYQQIN